MTTVLLISLEVESWKGHQGKDRTALTHKPWNSDYPQPPGLQNIGGGTAYSCYVAAIVKASLQA